MEAAAEHEALADKTVTFPIGTEGPIMKRLVLSLAIFAAIGCSRDPATTTSADSSGASPGIVYHAEDGSVIPYDPAEAAYKRGLAHLQKGEYNEAAAKFKVVMELRPTHPDAHVQRVKAFRLAQEQRTKIKKTENPVDEFLKKLQ